MLEIIEPVHGAVLNRHTGRQTEDALIVPVRGRAERNEVVTVNGTPTRRSGEEFFGEAKVRAGEADITARTEGAEGRREHTVRVVWDRYSKRRYRFSIDDNSFFLREIAAKGCEYKSLFDNFYLAFLRELNAEFGTKFTVNVFHETPEADFNLSRFPDRHKGEWADNGEWLKLAFHARAEFPDRPYEHSPAAQLAADYDLVTGEILRFAGEAAYAPATVIHWGMCQPDSLVVLAERGVRALTTLLWRVNDRWDINYLLDDARCDYLFTHDAIKDFDSGIVFSNCDCVINATPLEEIVPTLERSTAAPETSEVLDLLTHEQYFWEFYFNYRPDHQQRCRAAVRWATENGYEPVFFHEGLLGGCGVG